MKEASRKAKLFVVKNRYRDKVYNKVMLTLPKDVLRFFEDKDQFNVFYDKDTIILTKREAPEEIAVVQDVIRDIKRAFELMDILFSEFTESQRERILEKHRVVIQELILIRKKYAGGESE